MKPGLGGRILVVMLATTAAAGVAQAADATCTGYGALSSKPTLALGTITGAPRTFFVKGSADAEGCPDGSDKCRAKSFLVPGDPVILERHQGAFVCADYLDAKGEDHAGWLPADSLAQQPDMSVPLDGWVGRWQQTEGSVTVKRGRQANGLAIKGDATWGASDPDRVKRGAINVGEIAGEATPVGSSLSFDMGDTATLPVEKGDPYDCKVWMQRLGPYLLIDDNNQCGGMNVSFRGIYTRKP